VKPEIDLRFDLMERKRASALSRMPNYDKRTERNSTENIRSNSAHRFVVVAAGIGVPRTIDFHRLFHVGRVPRDPLLFWQLHFAVLFAGNFWGLAAQLVWTETQLVASVARFLTGAGCSLGAWRISGDLLLLPRRVLQGILGRSARLHSG
jgi:hypothetical protein